MTTKQILSGKAMALAAEESKKKTVPCISRAIQYCFRMEEADKYLSEKGYAGIQRIYYIWSHGSKSAILLPFNGDKGCDRAVCRGTLMELNFNLKSTKLATTEILLKCEETFVLLNDMMSGGWFE